ncbi:MAG: hypothetical protein LQ338_002648 [Usnochroma carphineum]|nr:MAG: hypothetical protein LQ338_002648 [Usnochroma carphineum]
MDAAIHEAESFVAPVLKRDKRNQGKSIIEVLSREDNSTTQDANDEKCVQQRRGIIDKALRTIQDLHASCGDSSNDLDQPDASASQRRQKVVDALLDLLVLEGIYPSLSPGVGVPVERRLKSALKASQLLDLLDDPGLDNKRIASYIIGTGFLMHQILETHMKISATESQLLLLSDNLLWDGSPLWHFMPGANGGIEIRKRDHEHSDLVDMVKIVESIDDRVIQYSSLLRAAIVTDDQLGKIFTHVSKRWLLGSPATPAHEMLDGPGNDIRDPVQSLVYAKLTEKLLQDYKDRITSSFEGIVQLVDPILSAFVVQRGNSVGRRGDRSQPSLSGLSEIVSGDDETEDNDQDSEATVSTALGLLSTVLTFSDGNLGNTDTDLLNRVQDSLKYVAHAQSQDSSLKITASNVLMLLQLQRESPDAFKAEKNTTDIDVMEQDRNDHRKAVRLLSDELAPVRAQGLSTLTELVSTASPVLDISSTVILLISLLQDEDEYIYLSAITALGLLASKHPKTVVQMLVEKYTDPHEESTLDVRIKVGEALIKTIQQLGQLFVEGVANSVGESMIAVASRRGERPRTLQKRERAKRKAEKAKKEAEDAWDGEIPGQGEGENDDDEEKMNAHVAKIVEGWADTGREEDIRIRTSALSILGSAIETNIAGVGATVASTAIDCVLAILKLEKSAERAILRRAAVTVIMSLVKAIDAAEERGQQLGFGFAGENLAEVITVLRYVEVTDPDEVVVGHVRAVIESLKAWQQKSLLGFSGSREVPEMDFSLAGPKIGGIKRDVKIEELE